MTSSFLSVSRFLIACFGLDSDSEPGLGHRRRHVGSNTSQFVRFYVTALCVHFPSQRGGAGPRLITGSVQSHLMCMQCQLLLNMVPNAWCPFTLLSETWTIRSQDPLHVRGSCLEKEEKYCLFCPQQQFLP